MALCRLSPVAGVQVMMMMMMIMMMMVMMMTSSLELGRSMGWLLEPMWAAAWVDSNDTFCDSFYRNPQTLQHFLKFTQKTLSGCPERCDCEVADEQRKVSTPVLYCTYKTGSLHL